MWQFLWKNISFTFSNLILAIHTLDKLKISKIDYIGIIQIEVIILNIRENGI